jgi:hypothetical protein
MVKKCSIRDASINSKDYPEGDSIAGFEGLGFEWDYLINYVD